jgi:hypothetical protein
VGDFWGEAEARQTKVLEQANSYMFEQNMASVNIDVQENSN